MVKKMYKYKTKKDGQEIIVFRTKKQFTWTSDLNDCQSLVVSTSNRSEALATAKQTSGYCWG